ncbi:phenylalanyl-tRNA synthetase alpha subunit [Hydrogenivirga caldilitoris]|uniref:Phenylalanine--tRNA ligase alpha subunit n=1 Tax=Hydrogenivirga caldilitoris TaxID=246264 RepID=A0A497XRL5_9AQUI|nr:phenylalanine--tRNA ligase subunit alpha [Hydrogenivirga caldilitoris]RLJ70790.1 phenylalanyl-tRNA synthetase alpha subunit [Hydrogenivirga caldilitoris]
MNDLEDIKESALRDIASASNLQELQGVRSKYLGKKGLISIALKAIKEIPPEQRKDYGKKVNELKELVEEKLKEREKELKNRELEDKLSREWLDLTIPIKGTVGSLHPITVTLERIVNIFRGMGFTVEEGPEIELEKYNFDMLNIPTDHPAREMQDTFYVNKPGYLLRTHTSPVQIRTMLKRKPPIQMIAPGKVYRRDDDPTHSPMFHQVEGLVVNEYANFRHMKYVIEEFLREFFQTNLPVRFRTSYFPFTEPSAEVDIGCVICSQEGCRVCKETGWLEVMGCGMVHPNVLEACGIDTELYQGFAFGMGVERLAMLLYGIDNIKLFYENDIRFIRQF